ncbi:uncharacterized protein DS421_7g218650 [Arachis hypogaea]|nr:uncharacterized protein DS421_7g218650 [Arachis hypogaea]
MRVDDQPRELMLDKSATMFPEVGKAVRAASFYTLTPTEKFRDLRYVLVNCMAVEKFLDDFRVITKRKLRTKTMSQSHIDSVMHRKFSDWFKREVPLGSIMHSNELQWLACGTNVQVSHFTSYNVNGFKFRTLSREKGLKAQNSQVHVTFDTRSYASKRDSNVAVGSILYYEKLVDIIELNYSGKLEERDLFLCGSSFSLCKAIEEASPFSSLEHATSIERDLFNKLPIRAWLDAFSAHRHIVAIRPSLLLQVVFRAGQVGVAVDILKPESILHRRAVSTRQVDSSLAVNILPPAVGKHH